ncbi:FecR family protein [Gracilimonas sp.]|uniref:FecR family protein n=1 Tax=Gracilimonas sp. TaxID=1974203 RepID=UPI003BA86CB2
MRKEPEYQVLVNYLLGICTPKELDFIEQWLAQSPDNVQVLEQVLEKLNKAEHISVNKERTKNRLFRQVESDLIADHYFSKSAPTKVKDSQDTSATGLQKTALIVKSIALVVVVSIALIFTLQLSKSSHPADTAQTAEFHERQLSYGQTSTFRFNDGSVITLNGGSTLRYPEQFDSNVREVHLEGEAFFDIAPDKNRPFIVHVGNTITRVLGTSFNIKAYSNDEKMQVTVIEGKVGVSGKSKENEDSVPEQPIILEENQWATYHQSGEFFEQGEGNVWEQIAWKDQVLIFNDKPFSEVAKMLERWYGVDIILQGEQLQDVKLKGEHKNMSLERVLESIQFILGIEYTIEEQVVTIQAAE